MRSFSSAPSRNPRRYGVVEAVPAGSVGPFRRLRVTGMVEKPMRPKSHWAATAVYAFGPRLFPALEAVRRAEHPMELELTSGIRHLLAHGGRVAALTLSPRTGLWCSVGSPDGYALALARTGISRGAPLVPRRTIKMRRALSALYPARHVFRRAQRSFTR